MPVSVYQWLRFVHLGLRSILVLFEQARMGEDEVLVNAYPPVTRGGSLRSREWFAGFGLASTRKLSHSSRDELVPIRKWPFHPISALCSKK
ncbi:MAG: hypothetical protein L3J03_04940 [Desulfobacterales bacterium]|nr:hypothetical protein [Desulfobacterales bacterium]